MTTKANLTSSIATNSTNNSIDRPNVTQGRWSRNLSAQRHRELERLNQIERKRQFLELKTQTNLFHQMSTSVKGKEGSLKAPNETTGSIEVDLNQNLNQSQRQQEKCSLDKDCLTTTQQSITSNGLDMIDANEKSPTGCSKINPSAVNQATLTSSESLEDKLIGSERTLLSKGKGKDEFGADSTGCYLAPEAKFDRDNAFAELKPAKAGSDDTNVNSNGANNKTLAKITDSTAPASENCKLTTTFANATNLSELAGKRPISVDQLVAFVNSCVPKNKRVLCLIVRDKMSRLNKAKSYFYPTYYLFIQAIIDIDEKFKSGQVILADQQQLANADSDLSNLASNSCQLNASADNSFSASSSISADMMFIGPDGVGVGQGSSPANLLGGGSYSDNEVYAETETEEDATAPVDTSKASAARIGKKDDIQSISLHNKTSLPGFMSNPRLVRKSKGNFDVQTVANSLSELPQASLRQDELNDDDDDSSDNDDSNLKKDPNSSLNSATKLHKKDDQPQWNLFDNDKNPFAGTYGVLLAGRRRKKAKTYLIGPNEFGFTRRNSICKLKSNVIGTQFTAIGLNHAENNDRCTIASISYETNVLGFKGPRKMRVYLAKGSSKDIKNLPEIYKKNPSSVIQLKNMTPSWNVESQSYVLNFHGRVTQASVKNFQLIECDDHQNSDSFKASLQQPNAMASDSRPIVIANTSGQTQQEVVPNLDKGTKDLRKTMINSYNNHSELLDRRLDTTARTSDTFAKEVGVNKSVTKFDNHEYYDEEDIDIGGDACNFIDKNVLLGNKSLSYDSSIVMQFGRISNHEFTCDVTYPLSILQAFSIALSSFDSKLACE